MINMDLLLNNMFDPDLAWQDIRNITLRHNKDHLLSFHRLRCGADAAGTDSLAYPQQDAACSFFYDVEVHLR